MKNKIEALTGALKNNFDGDPWYGPSISKVLNAIDWKLANERLGGNHSIAELLAHMIQWRSFVTERLSGNASIDIEIDSASDWPQVRIDTIHDWEKLLNAFKQTQETLIAKILEKDEHFLTEPVPGRSYGYEELLEGILQHDIYHSGQIRMLSRQLEK